MKYSIIIPVYKNQESIPRLLDTLAYINKELEEELEAVFVVDGSPDFCFSMLREALPLLPYQARLIALSRNFGSMAAIRTGLAAVQGVFVSVMAADLQEPPGLVLQCFRALDNDECDVAVGTRISRNDSFITKITSRLFWWFYKRYIMPDMPEGGVDIFACNQKFKTQLLTLEESRSSLIALIFWLGFRRKLIGYERQARQEGRSAWTFRKKVDYMMDSIFAFTDLPLRLLLRVGMLGTIVSFLLGVVVLWGRLTGYIDVPGYATTVLLILFLGALNLFALGLVGCYAWRAYENTKSRPTSVIAISLSNSLEDPND